jgi:hypothetical protein
MHKRIIYKTESNGVIVIVPTNEYLAEHTIEELAASLVPENTQYEIVDINDIPQDRLFRDAWTWE